VFDVDFGRSVWSTIFKEKWKLGFIAFEALLQSAFGSFVAILIGYAFDQRNVSLFGTSYPVHLWRPPLLQKGNF
jgi:hypothetical protein